MDKLDIRRTANPDTATVYPVYNPSPQVVTVRFAKAHQTRLSSGQGGVAGVASTQYSDFQSARLNTTYGTMGQCTAPGWVVMGGESPASSRGTLATEVE